jgi:predicted RNase H-like HicB family nuclease
MVSMEFVYHVLYQPEPEGGFTAIVPTLPGCVTYGKTLKKAQEMAEEAISLYIEDLIANGERVPSDERAVSASVRVRPSKLASRRYAAKAPAKVARHHS